MISIICIIVMIITFIMSNISIMFSTIIVGITIFKLSLLLLLLFSFLFLLYIYIYMYVWAVYTWDHI